MVVLDRVMSNGGAVPRPVPSPNAKDERFDAGERRRGEARPARLDARGRRPRPGGAAIVAMRREPSRPQPVYHRAP
jgi:hypothetical protein